MVVRIMAITVDLIWVFSMMVVGLVVGYFMGIIEKGDKDYKYQNTSDIIDSYLAKKRRQELRQVKKK